MQGLEANCNRDFTREQNLWTRVNSENELKENVLKYNSEYKCMGILVLHVT